MSKKTFADAKSAWQYANSLIWQLPHNSLGESTEKDIVRGALFSRTSQGASNFVVLECGGKLGAVYISGGGDVKVFYPPLPRLITGHMKVPDGLKADLDDYNLVVATLLRDDKYLKLRQLEIELSQPRDSGGDARRQKTGGNMPHDVALMQLAKELNLRPKNR